MNSGIGPSEVINKAGIEALVESPEVGKNLQDHPAVGFIVSLDPQVTASYPNSYDIAQMYVDYILAVESKNVTVEQDFGLLGSAGISAGGFLKSPYSIDSVPDIQLTVNYF